MKKCPRCGLTFTDEERYCTSCGSPLEEVNESVSAEQPDAEQPSSEQPSSAQPETEQSDAEQSSAEQPETDNQSSFEQKASKAADDLSEALGELGAAAKKVADKIGDKAKESFGKIKDDETFSKYSDKAKDSFGKVMDTPDSTSDFDADDVNNNKIISLFAYCGILFIVPLLAGKDSRYARFHTNQGIILFIFSIVVAFLSTFHTIGWIFKVCHVLVVLLVILGIINAVTGKARELPLIGQFRILK